MRIGRDLATRATCTSPCGWAGGQHVWAEQERLVLEAQRGGSMKEITDLSVFGVKKALYVIRSTSPEHPNHYTFGCSGVRGNGNLAKRLVRHDDPAPAKAHMENRKGTVSRHEFYPFGKPIWALDMDGSAPEKVLQAEADLRTKVKHTFGVEGESVFIADCEDKVREMCGRFAAAFFQHAATSATT
jgi:hypothetical protein